MPRNAPWAMEYKKRRDEEVPQQMTVVRRIQTPNSYGVSRETMGYSGGMEMAEPITPSRMTGAGVDGIVQPGKRTGEVHEDEGVLNRNAMQALGPELFMSLSKSLESGTADINKIREAIKESPMQGFQGGGIARNPLERNRGLGVPSSEATPVEDTPQPISVPFSPTVPKQTFTPIVQPPEQEEVALPTITVPPPPTVPNQVFTPIVQPPKQEEVTLPSTPSTQMTDTLPAPINQPPNIATSGTRRGAFGYGPPEEEKPPEETTTDTAGQTAMSRFAHESVRNALQYFNNQSQGMSESDRNIANYYLSNMDATNAANQRVLESQISQDPYMSDSAKRVALAAADREFQARRSQFSGDLAMSAQQRADASASEAARLGMDVQRYEDITRPQAQQAMELERRQYEEITLPTSRQNLDIAKRAFEEIELPTGKVNLEILKSSFNNQQWDDIQGMINKGMSRDRINEALRNMGIDPLSDAEYLGMLEATPLGERNYGRQLSAANMLLQTPGATNKEAAATMYSNIFPGVDFDFSQLISMENAEIFGTGLSQMSSYVATDANFDEVLTAMKKDGTLDMMGMDENQAAQLYNSLRVNSIDAEWEEFETSEFFNSLTPEEQNEQREFFEAKVLGKLDYVTLHEYNLYDADGNLIKSIFSKDATEANKAAAKEGLIAEDTGRVQFRMASTIDTSTTPPDETPKLQDAWDEFMKSQELLPIEQQVGQKTWFDLAEKYGVDKVPKSIEEWKKSDLVPTTAPLTDIQVENYSDLLSKANSEKLFETFKEDPDAVRGSEFYYELPDVEYIANNINPEQATGDKRSTKLTADLKKNLEDSIGKMIELPLREGVLAGESIPEGQTTISGQLVDVDETPNTIQLKIKTADGTTKSYVLFSWDKIGDPQKDNAQGTIMGQPYEDKTYKV